MGPNGHPEPLPREKDASSESRRPTSSTKGRLRQLRLGRSLATIACHSAVRLGDRLSRHETEALIKDWLSSRYSATCPHGRPICYRLDHKEIARKLDRH